jgi:small-conductance mechanosensitive channel
MENTINTLREELLLFLPTIAVSIILFLIFWLVARIARKVIRRIGESANLAKEVTSLLEDVIGLAILAFGLITALGTLGINVAAMVAGLGLTGFALGFALQDTIANTLAGILILLYKPFGVGDRIKAAGHEGEVIDINLRYTSLQGEGNRILIPNQTLFKEALIVYDATTGEARTTTITGEAA